METILHMNVFWKTAICVSQNLQKKFILSLKHCSLTCLNVSYIIITSFLVGHNTSLTETDFGF